MQVASGGCSSLMSVVVMVASTTTTLILLSGLKVHLQLANLSPNSEKSPQILELIGAKQTAMNQTGSKHSGVLKITNN